MGLKKVLFVRMSIVNIMLILEAILSATKALDNDSSV